MWKPRTISKVCALGAFLTWSSSAQGTFDFNNLGPDQEIWLPGQAGVAGPGAAGVLQLYYEGNPLLANPVSFFDLPGATQWILPPPIILVQGGTPGTTATIEVRVWEASFGSFDAAAAGSGFHSDNANEDWTFETVFGGVRTPGEAPVPVGTGLDFTRPGGFILTMPEPSTMVLTLLGLPALIVFVRKHRRNS